MSDEHDREFEDFLARRSALHRRLSNRDFNEPSAELDRLVLNKAREAIRMSSGAPLYHAQRWALPVSLAATVVLGLAIVMNFSRLQRGGYPVAATAASPAAGAAKLNELAPAAVAPERELAEQAFAAEQPAIAREMRPEPAANARSASDLFARDLSTSDKASTRSPAPAAAKPDSAVKMPAAVKAASAPPPATTGALAGATSAVVANARATNAQGSDARTAMMAKRERAAGAAATDTAIERVEVTGLKREPSTYVAAVPMAAVAADSSEADPSAPPPAETARAAAPGTEAKHTDPQAWLREIEALRAAGKKDEADRELAQFRKAFPNETTALPAPRDPRPAQ